MTNFLTCLAQAPAGTKMLVIAGLHHIQGRTGIPDRVAKRLPEKEHLVVVARTTHGSGIGGRATIDLADWFVVFTSAPAKIGAVLKNAEGGGVLIEKVSEGGAAAAAGIEPGVVIVEFGGKPVTDVADVRYVLDAAAVGEQVIAVLELRGEDGTTTETVTLTLAPLPPRPLGPAR